MLAAGLTGLLVYMPANAGNGDDITNAPEPIFADQFQLFSSVCPAGYRAQGVRCVTPFGCAAPQLELTTIGGVPLIGPDGEPLANVQRSCVERCDSPATPDGPGRCALALP